MTCSFSVRQACSLPNRLPLQLGVNPVILQLDQSTWTAVLFTLVAQCSRLVAQYMFCSSSVLNFDRIPPASLLVWVGCRFVQSKKQSTKAEDSCCDLVYFSILIIPPMWYVSLLLLSSSLWGLLVLHGFNQSNAAAFYLLPGRHARFFIITKLGSVCATG